MKRLDKPVTNPADVYDACVSGIDDPNSSARLATARAAVIASFQAYDQRANTHQLFSFAASDWGNNTQQVLNGVTKKELVELYSEQMVKKRPGRSYYESLIVTPLGLCPYCGFGHVSTLDHFLPKARYPLFSVLCANLIPSCSDCNKGKGASEVTQSNQIPHPYFEEEIIETEDWLFAEVIESAPDSVRYFVRPPASWPGDLTQRATNYFRDFNLARRFSVEAASELSGLALLLDGLGTPDLRQTHLSMVARVERKNRKNSWKAALYEALAASDWFQRGGYCYPNH